MQQVTNPCLLIQHSFHFLDQQAGQLRSFFFLLFYAGRSLVNMAPRHFSDLDFSDGNSALDNMNSNYLGMDEPSHIQRNKSERRRLQGLQRAPTVLATRAPVQPKKFNEKWDLWMINEGGRQLFFAVWIVLHLLVAAFGTVNYQLKDNLVNARAAYGLSFSAWCQHFFLFCCF